MMILKHKKNIIRTTASLDIKCSPPFTKTIIFGRINANVSKSELWDYFYQFGNILKISVEFNSKEEQFEGLGYVTVGDEMTFNNILSSTHYFKGCLLLVNHSDPQTGNVPMLHEDLRIKVTNIPDKLTRGQFEYIFGELRI